MKIIHKVDGRTLGRSRCRIDSRITYLNQQADGRVIDVSRQGMALEVYGRINAARGSNVTIENNDIGLIEGTVRWSRDGRLGIQIKPNSNSLAKLTAYFRNFHREVRPVLGR